MTIDLTVSVPNDIQQNLNDKSKKLRIIIKEKGGGWQSTVLRNMKGLPQKTKWSLTCFPGKGIDYETISTLSQARTSELSKTTDCELFKIHQKLQHEGIMAPVPIQFEAFDKWYQFVNEKLWAKFHKLDDEDTENICFEEWQLYRQINQSYALALAKDIIEDILNDHAIELDVNWVHDYQLLLVMSELEPAFHNALESMPYTTLEIEKIQRVLPTALKQINTSYFHHIPWPDIDIYKKAFPIINKKPPALDSDTTSAGESVALPINTGKEILLSLLNAQHLGFQTPAHLLHFLNAVTLYCPEAIIETNEPFGSIINLSGRKILANVHPISTDYELFSKADFSASSIIDTYAKTIDADITLNMSYEDTSAPFESMAQNLKEAIESGLLKTVLNDVIKHIDGIASYTNQSSIEAIFTPAVFNHRTASQIMEQLLSLGVVISDPNKSLILNIIEVIQQKQRALNETQHQLIQDEKLIQELKQFSKACPDTTVYTSIGRLDPEKNVPVILKAYINYLNHQFLNHLPITNRLLLLVAPSRLGVPAYQQELKDIISQLDIIQTLFREQGLDSNLYINVAGEDLIRDVIDSDFEMSLTSPKILTANGMGAFYRLGQSTIISSRADGMNLVIKEWLAAQERILSKALHELIEFTQQFDEKSLTHHLLEDDEASLLTTYLHALKVMCPESPGLSKTLHLLQHHFHPILSEFFGQYRGELPSRPLISQNAGAAVQLHEANIINPLDSASIEIMLNPPRKPSPIKEFAKMLRLSQSVKAQNGLEWRRSIIDAVLFDTQYEKAARKVANALKNKDGILVLDVDGTLSPIVKRPRDAALNHNASRGLLELNRMAGNHVVINTGRDIENVLDVFHLRGHHLTIIGSHGLEIRMPSGDTKCLVDFSPEEQTLLDRIHSTETISELSQQIKDILQPYHIDEHVIDIESLIEVKKYSLSILSGPLKDVVSEDNLQHIEDAFACILQSTFIDEAHSSAPTSFTVMQGIHICEIKYQMDKGQALEQLLSLPEYEHCRYVCYAGDDFGQPHQKGTDYYAAQWINKQRQASDKAIDGEIIQVMPHTRISRQKQHVSSPARPDFIVQSPELLGQFLLLCSENLKFLSASPLLTQLTTFQPTASSQLTSSDMYVVGPSIKGSNI